MADEESVDMEQRRDEQPQPESGPPPSGLIPADGKLSPVQQAQHRRRVHASHCRQCADIDRQLCTEGERLLQAWTAALDDAYEQLHRQTP